MRKQRAKLEVSAISSMTTEKIATTEQTMFLFHANWIKNSDTQIKMKSLQVKS
jgi:hypothetical protein